MAEGWQQTVPQRFRAAFSRFGGPRTLPA